MRSALWSPPAVTCECRGAARALEQPTDVARRRPEGARRLLLVWSRPGHLTDAQADAWVCGQVDELLQDDRTQRARLVRLARASPSWPQPFDWMLALDVHADGAREPALGPVWEAWLADLRQLGMGPVAMVAIDVLSIAAGKPSMGGMVAGRDAGPQIGAGVPDGRVSRRDAR